MVLSEISFHLTQRNTNEDIKLLRRISKYTKLYVTNVHMEHSLCFN